MSNVDRFKSNDNELIYKVSVYDFENNLMKRLIGDTEIEKNKIIEYYYNNNEKAAYYEVRMTKIFEKDIKNKEYI